MAASTLATRERVRRHRERARETKRLWDMAQAERLELVNESLAPRVLRMPVEIPERRFPGGLGHDPGRGWRWTVGGVMADARVLVGPRVAIEGGLPVRAIGCDLSALTQDHLRAARRLSAAWDAVGTGVGVRAVDYLRTGGGGGGTTPAGHGAMLAQVRLRAELEAALAHLGAFVPVVAAVILDCVPISQWAAGTGRTLQDAVAFLRLALDRLASHYWPEPEARTVRIRTIGPPRDAYGMDA